MQLHNKILNVSALHHFHGQIWSAGVVLIELSERTISHNRSY